METTLRPSQTPLRSALLLSLAALHLGCDPELELSSLRFACGGDADCLPTYACEQGICVSRTEALSTDRLPSSSSNDGNIKDEVANGGTGTGAATYSIGGTVVGLAGGPLVLQNNGIDEVAIRANGAFTFPLKQRAGSTYAVAIKAGGVPTGLGQACAITSGATGTVTGGDVGQLRVRCSFQVRGTGGAIPDSAFETCAVNSAGSPLVSTATVTNPFFNIGSMVVALENLNHSFSGDLRATLEHVSTGAKVTLLDRMPNGACEAEQPFAGTFRISDAFSPTFCANAASSTGVISGGNYAPCAQTGMATRFSSAPPAGFAGESVQGTWRLTVEDMESADTGSLGSWSITFLPP